MKPLTGYAPSPHFCYVLRRWITENRDSCQAAVLVIRSAKELYPDQLMDKVKDLVSDPESFVLVESPMDSVIVLDTWQREIDFEIPIESIDPVCFADWWSWKKIRKVAP